MPNEHQRRHHGSLPDADDEEELGNLRYRHVEALKKLQWMEHDLDAARLACNAVAMLLPYPNPHHLVKRFEALRRDLGDLRARMRAHHVYDHRDPAGCATVDAAIAKVGFIHERPGLFTHKDIPHMHFAVVLYENYVPSISRQEASELLEASKSWATDGKGSWHKKGADESDWMNLRDAYACEFGA